MSSVSEARHPRDEGVWDGSRALISITLPSSAPSRTKPARRLLPALFAVLMIAAMLPAGAAAASPSSSAASESVAPVVTPMAESSVPAAIAAGPVASYPTVQLDPNPVQAKIAKQVNRHRADTLMRPGGASPATGKPSFLTSKKPGSKSSASTPTPSQTPAASPAIAMLVVSPAMAEVAWGATQAYTARAFDAQGRPIGDVTRTTTFSVDGLPCTGSVCAPRFSGAHRVVAENGGVQGEASVVVRSDSGAAVANRGAVSPAAQTSAKVSGRVTDSAGKGLAGIQAEIWGPGGGQFAVSDATGNFSFTPFSTGSHWVAYLDPQGVYLKGVYTSTGFSIDEAKATLIEVGLADISISAVVLPRAIQISGRVTNAGGAGLSGISVGTISLAYQSNAMTDADGHFSIGVAPNLTYRMRAWDPDQVYAAGYYSTAGWKDTEADATQVAVASAPISAIGIVMPASVHISGRVTNQAGQGVPQVYAAWEDENLNHWSSQTDANGNYTIAVLPNSRVTIAYEEMSNTYVKGYYSVGGLVFDIGARSTITVGEADVTGINIVLPLGVRISGHVTDRSGAPLDLVGVVAVSDEANPNFWRGWTDSNGNFSIVVAPDDTYAIRFWGYPTYADGYYRGTGKSLAGSMAWALPIDVGTTPVTGIDIALALNVAFSGHVSNTAGANLSGVQVAACRSEDNYCFMALTDTAGLFSIVVTDGDDYIVWLIDPSGEHATVYYVTGGYSTSEYSAEAVFVGPEGVAGLEAVMPEYLHLSGVVTGEGAGPLGNIEVVLFDPADGTVVEDVLTDASGHWSAMVAPGMCVYFYDADQEHASGYLAEDGFTYFLESARSIAADSEDLSSLDIVLPLPLHISGTVTGPGPTELGGILVTVYDATSYVPRGSDTTDSNGAYSVVVVPGSHVVQFFDGSGTYPYGYWSEAGLQLPIRLAESVVVDDSDVGGIDVQLPAGFHIAGTVTDEDGAPVPSVEIDIFNDLGDLVDFTYAQDDGSYSTTMPVGSYYLAFIDPNGTYAVGYWNGGGFTQDPAAMTTVDIVSADILDVDVRLPRALSEPTGVTAVAGNRSATVTWTAPAYTGGAPVTSYDVWSDPDNRLCTWTGGPLTCTVTGLSNGTPYQFYVYAENVGGLGPESDPSNTVTPATLPSAPGAIQATGTVSAIRVSWSAATPNGSAIIRYTATANPGGSQCVATTGLTCTINGLSSKTAYTVSVTATNGVGTGPAGSSASSVTPRVGATFVGLTPNRLVDTRNGTGLSSKVSAYTAATFQVTGRNPGDAARNVPADATAVTGILSVSGASALGWLSLTPEPNDHPTTSTINFPKTDARSTGVTVPLGSGGKLSVTYGATPGNTAGVIFDVTGYFVTNTTGSTYKALTTNRLVDSRSTTKVGLTSGLTAGTAKTFLVANRTPTVEATNVPPNAVAVTGTLTVTNQTAAGFLTLGPDALNAPTTTSLFFPKGDNRASGLTVKLGAGGTLGVTFTSAVAGSKTDVIFDVTGYFLPGTSGATYVPLTPNRIVDNRINLGITGKLKNRVAATFTVINRVPADATKNVPSGAVAVTGTLTVTGQSYLGFLSLTKTATNNPTTSSLNFPKGDNRATGVTAPLSPTGTLSVTYGAISGATTYVVFDVTGYFLN
jgi:hypothetical protein